MSIDEKILERAHQLFVKKGIRNVTMDELAQSLGMSKRTIYEHFKDKKTLVYEAASHFVYKINAEADVIINNADNVIQGITQVLMFAKSTYMSVISFYFLDMKRYFPEAYELLAQRRTIRKGDMTYMLVTRGIKEGLFRENMNVRLIGFFVSGILLANNDLKSEVGDLKYGDFERDVLFAYLMGIATEKGRVLIMQEQEKYFNQMDTYGLKIPECPF